MDLQAQPAFGGHSVAVAGRFARRAPALASHLSLPGDHRWPPAAAGPTSRRWKSAAAETGRRSGAWAQDTREDRPHGRGKPYGLKQIEVLDTTG